MMARILVTLRKSPIGRDGKQRRILESMGLRKMNQAREFEDTPDVRGKVFKVKHLVEVSEVG